MMSMPRAPAVRDPDRRGRARLPALAVLLAGALACAPGCSWNKATRSLKFNLVSERDEIALGRQADEQVVEDVGVYAERPGLNTYVTRVGAALVRTGERQELPWTFRVLDDPEVNAFAGPGGFVYVTRGLLTHLSSEAELAAVLGHEIAHVNALHGVNQLSRMKIARGGVGLFRVIDPNLRHVGGFVAGSAGLALLRRSREDEEQADTLGLRYMTASGYAPGGMSRVLAMLTAVSAQHESAEAREAWLSTHPAPAARKQRIDRALAERGVDPEGGRWDQEPYLRELDGALFGDDPRDGFVRGASYFRPRSGYRVDFPASWELAHDKTMVAGVLPDQEVIIAVGLTSFTSAREATAAFLGETSLPHGPTQTVTLNGFPGEVTEFRDRAGQAVLQARALFVEYGAQVVALLAFAAIEQWARHQPAIDSTFASFRTISDPALREPAPARVKLVVLTEPLRPPQLLGPDAPPELDAGAVARINQVTVEQTIPAGTMVKRVVVVSPARAGASSEAATPG